MLKHTPLAIIAFAALTEAQPVLSGMGKSPSDYTAIWGAPARSLEGPLDTREQVWTAHRKGGFTGQDFEVHVLFRKEKAVEERWVRSGSDLWDKAELWTVLDGKGVKFELLHQGTPLSAPFTVLQSPNTLINFQPPKGEMVAQLQNTLQGPQLKISSRDWAQTKQEMGLANTQEGGGRLASQGSQSRQRPTWGGKSISVLTSGLKDLGVKGNAHAYLPKTGKGTLTIAARKGTRLELVVPEPQALAEPNRILGSRDPVTGKLRDALKDSFRRFFSLANYSVPGIIGGTEWSADHTDGIFSEDNLQDLSGLKQMPSEFPLLTWKDALSGETWDLVATTDGYRLVIQWPAGNEPR